MLPFPSPAASRLYEKRVQLSGKGLPTLCTSNFPMRARRFMPCGLVAILVVGAVSYTLCFSSLRLTPLTLSGQSDGKPAGSSRAFSPLRYASSVLFQVFHYPSGQLCGLQYTLLLPPVMGAASSSVGLYTFPCGPNWHYLPGSGSTLERKWKGVRRISSGVSRTDTLRPTGCRG